MDFKGYFSLGNGQRCNPLSVLDDHSRFVVCLQACRDQTGPTVQARLTETFQRYGLPERMLMDNGPPWGNDADHPYTPLTVWLLRLGVGVCHGRPYHPQTQEKAERFQRTVQVELLQGRSYWDHPQVQTRFDGWRPVYNHERPHQALGMAVPLLERLQMYRGKGFDVSDGMMQGLSEAGASGWPVELEARVHNASALGLLLRHYLATGAIGSCESLEPVIRKPVPPKSVRRLVPLSQTIVEARDRRERERSLPLSEDDT